MSRFFSTDFLTVVNSTLILPAFIAIGMGMVSPVVGFTYLPSVWLMTLCDMAWSREISSPVRGSITARNIKKIETEWFTSEKHRLRKNARCMRQNYAKHDLIIYNYLIRIHFTLEKVHYYCTYNAHACVFYFKGRYRLVN